ncbi:MAG: ABC transporter ATP-binding protein [Micrococcus sp.]|nr:ABC transporter ATP-binding protein [Micrococcus sp.]
MFGRRRSAPRPDAAPRDEAATPRRESASRDIHLSGVRVEASSQAGVHVLLDDVDLLLDAPRVAVVGENGSGKSTLARTIAGLTPPVGGTIEVHGVDAVADVKGLRRTVGFVFANPAAQSIMPTVREDVELTVKNLRDADGNKLPHDEVRERVDAALASHRLTELADRPCLSLSSGQAQRLALCAVLAAQPSVVLADEPTSLLDGRHRRIIAERLLAAEDFQLVLVTHDLALARACEQAVWIHDARVHQVGESGAVIDAYERFLEESWAEERPGGGAAS